MSTLFISHKNIPTIYYTRFAMRKNLSHKNLSESLTLQKNIMNQVKDNIKFKTFKLRII